METFFETSLGLDLKHASCPDARQEACFKFKKINQKNQEELKMENQLSIFITLITAFLFLGVGFFISDIAEKEFREFAFWVKLLIGVAFIWSSLTFYWWGPATLPKELGWICFLGIVVGVATSTWRRKRIGKVIDMTPKT